MSDAPITDSAIVVPVPNPQHQISFVDPRNGKVEDTIWVPDRLAAVLMSNPLIVYSKGVRPTTSQTTYDPATKTFTHPDGVTEQAEEYDPEK